MERITVREFLSSLGHQAQLGVVTPGASLKDVVRAMVKGHRRRMVYVVDGEGKLIGAISLDVLKDVIFRFYLSDRVSDIIVVSEHITELFTSEKAEDVMDPDISSCQEQETLHEVLARMIERNIRDLPVLDQQGRVIADLDILDLLELWLKKREKALQ
ncbi:MAG: CBS domain-containing protein [Deltaproteobacteria bacterium]|nr:CBS domain-containing protein [Deltaproteobacteria bacterium]